MGDSENSRTVPAITCRNLLKTAEWLLTAQIADRSHVSQGSGDDALGHWRAWLGAFERLERLSAVQQRLEAELLEASSLNVRRGDAGLRSLACVIAADDGRVEAYRQAEQAMEDAAEIEDLLAFTLSAADGASIAAVVAKLHCVLQRGEHDPGFEAFPWPELSRVLDDLLSIDGRIVNIRQGGVLQPIDSG